jgi:hypothetical protein
LCSTSRHIQRHPGAYLGAHHALKPAAQRWVFKLLIVALALELLGFLRIYWDEEVLRQFR